MHRHRDSRRSGLRSLTALSVVGSLAVLTAPAPALAVDLGGAVWLRTFTGTYGLEERALTVVAEGEVDLTSDRWRLRLTVPFVWQRDGAVAVEGIAPVPIAPRQGPGHGGGQGPGPGGQSGRDDGEEGDPDEDETFARSASGIGDPRLRVDAVVMRRGRSAVTVFGAVKAPLAEVEDGFSTGEWDLGGGASVEHRSGRSLFRFEAGAWSLGDPSWMELRDAVRVEAEWLRSASRQWWAGVGASATSEIVPGLGDAVSVSLLAGTTRFAGGSFALRLRAGLTEAAGDAALEIGWRSR